LTEPSLSATEDFLQQKNSNDSPNHETQRSLGIVGGFCVATLFLIFFLTNGAHGIIIPQHGQLKVYISTGLIIVDVRTQIRWIASIGTQRASFVATHRR
jgi:hypothetical protein